MAGELKTKPTQHSVKELLSVGIQPDMLLCRSECPIPDNERRKIALFCNVKPECIIEALDCNIIYQIPINYHEQGIDERVVNYFKLPAAPEPDLSKWHDIVARIKEAEGTVTIAVVGKYISLLDSYKSLAEAIAHGGIANKAAVKIKWVDAADFDEDPELLSQQLQGVDGVLVPGGFGERGTEGKIAAVKFAREKNIPYFGICFGMQLAVIEAVRNLGGLPDASTSEFGASPHCVIGLITEWIKNGEVEIRKSNGDLGGTMRLGAYPSNIKKGTKAYAAYGQKVIHERHRHRYEVNTNYAKNYEQAGLVFSGMSPDDSLPEIIERADHPWFVGVQFHPELKSRPLEPHPLFTAFIAAAIKKSRLV